MSPEDKKKSGIEKLNIIRSVVPAITHVDYSSRVHTVDQANNAFYHQIIKAFYQKTGCPVIINTSFNVRGEPIVCTPEDAYNCFKNTDMDFLLLENFLIEKKPGERKGVDNEWLKSFPLD